jgi:hypothetical protein
MQSFQSGCQMLIMKWSQTINANANGSEVGYGEEKPEPQMDADLRR